MKLPTEDELADAVYREMKGDGDAGEIHMEQMAKALEASPAGRDLLDSSLTAALRAGRIIKQRQGHVPPVALESIILSALGTGVAIGMRIGERRRRPKARHGG